MARSGTVVQIAPISDEFDLPYILPSGKQKLEFQVAVMGLSPLLCHSALSMLAPKNKRVREIPTAEEEAAKGAYVTESGDYAMLGIAFQRSLVEASSVWKARRGRLTMTSFVAHVEVLEEYLPLIDPETRRPLTDYIIDRRTVVLQGARIVRARPRFERWAIGRISFLYDPGLIEPAEILQILDDAGTRRGIGDFRPGKSKGRFGRFAVVGIRLSRETQWQSYQPDKIADIERLEDRDETEAAP